MADRIFWLKFALVRYVALDFANPLMPGAVNFDPDTSGDGITAHHQLPRSLFVSAVTSVPVSMEFRPVPHVGRSRPRGRLWTTGSPTSDEPTRALLSLLR